MRGIGVEDTHENRMICQRRDIPHAVWDIEWDNYGPT
jgi:hypothetical protein